MQFGNIKSSTQVNDESYDVPTVDVPYCALLNIQLWSPGRTGGSTRMTNQVSEMCMKKEDLLEPFVRPPLICGDGDERPTGIPCE